MKDWVKIAPLYPYPGSKVTHRFKAHRTLDVVTFVCGRATLESLACSDDAMPRCKSCARNVK